MKLQHLDRKMDMLYLPHSLLSAASMYTCCQLQFPRFDTLDLSWLEDSEHDSLLHTQRAVRPTDYHQHHAINCNSVQTVRIQSSFLPKTLQMSHI